MKKMFKRAYVALSSIFAIVVCNLLPANAAGFNTDTLKDGMKTGLMAVISITGAGLAVFGVIHLIEAQASTDPNAKSTAIKQLAGGLGLVIVGAIMIPIFIDSITF